MPLRSQLPSSIRLPGFPPLPFLRSFHSSPRCSSAYAHPQQSLSHYETLNIHPTATQSEIKTRFYELSKKHHPDHNPNDPDAGKRFIKISTAYSVLSRADTRKTYDRELGARQHGTPSHHYAGSARGSRPASGLSRRRTQPKGPPPSYYAHGGGRGGGGYTGRMSSTSAEAEMGFRGTAASENQDAPHFNWEGKRKQHETHEARWASRPKKEHVVELSTVIKFAAVSGILGFTMVLTSEWKRERTETKRKGRA